MSRLLQVYSHNDVTVTFDPRRCIHSAECIRRLPDVFDSAARPWVRPERAQSEAIVNAVLACPTGALRVQINGQQIEATDEQVHIKVGRHGPLMVRGPVRVVTDDGEVLVTDTRVALCRCGNSKRQPLCDGSHRQAGFRDPQ